MLTTSWRGPCSHLAFLGWVWPGALAAQASAPAAYAIGTAVAEGHVLGPLGAPMVGIEVWAAVWPELDEVVARSRTDGDGMFVLGKLPLGNVSLFASAPGFSTGWGNVTLSPDAPAGSDRLRLWEAVTVRGRVLDPEGKPVAGATVLGTKDYAWYEGRFRSPESLTDAEGKFELGGIPIGDCVLRVWKPGFVMLEQPLRAVQDEIVEARLSRGEGTRLLLRAEGLLAGLTTPVRVWIHATRQLYGFPLPRCIENGVLDHAGRLELRGLPDAEWNVELITPEFAFEPRSVQTKEGERTRDVVFQATRLGNVRLRGTLAAPDGKPLADERLVCNTQRSPAMNSGNPGLATTDAVGRFDMAAPLAPDEPYSLHLAASGWVLRQEKGPGMKGQHDCRYLVRYEDRAETGRELRLVAVPATLVTGKVIDPSGGSVPFVWTELQEAQSGSSWYPLAYATSRRDGTIAFTGVHATDRDVRVRAVSSSGAGESEPFRLETGRRTEVRVVVRPGGVVEGRLTDAAGKPLAGVAIALRNVRVDTGRQIDGGWSNVPTDREGRYRFVGVAPGGHRVDLEVRRREGPACQSEPFEVAPGKTVKQDLQLAPK